MTGLGSLWHFVLPLSIKVGAKYSLYDIPVLPVHTIYNVVDVKSKIINIFLFDGSMRYVILTKCQICQSSDIQAH